MAITNSTAYQVRELYTNYINESFTKDLNLSGTGIITSLADLDAIAASEGHSGAIRYYGNVDATVNVQDETDTKAVPQAISTGLMNAIKSANSTSWSVGDLSRVLTNQNALIEVSRQAAQARALNEQADLIRIMRGVLADNHKNDSGDAMNVIAKTATGAAATGNAISRKAVVDMVSKLEGNPRDFVMVMNHAASGDLANLDGTTLIRTSDNPMFEGSFMGIPVMVNNQIADITGTANSFLNGAAAAAFDNSKVQRVIYFVRVGGFAYSPIAMPTPVGVERDELAGSGSGTTTVVYRWGHVLHPLGYDYSGATTAYASATLLTAAASWDRKWTSIKNQPVGAVVYNG